jgi:group I intron endonuclease
MPICKALIKFGYSNFSLEILEYCEPDVRFEKEKYYLKLLKPEYNIILDVAPFSAETTEKMPKVCKVGLYRSRVSILN